MNTTPTASRQALRTSRQRLTLWAKTVRAACAAVGASGIVAAFLQQTDPHPQWAYFTVESAAIVTATSAAMALTRTPTRTLLQYLADCGTVGAALSGIVWMTLLTPDGFYAPQDDTAVRIANTLLHLVLPSLAVVATTIEPRHTRMSWTRPIAWLAWPALYLVATATVTTVTNAMSPYAFLNPGVSGWGLTLGAVTGMAAIALLLGIIITLLRRLVVPSHSV